MIIKKLSFNNFKSFNDSHQSLEEFDITTLVYGENNSGKSNVLKFIDLLFRRKLDFGDPYLVGGQAESREVEKGSFWKGVITGSAYLFHKNDRSIEISFDIVLGVRRWEFDFLENANTILATVGDKKSIEIRIKGKIVSLIDPNHSEMITTLVKLEDKEIYRKGDSGERFFNDIAAIRGDSVTFSNLMSLFNDCVIFLDHNRFLVNEIENDGAAGLTPNSFKNWLHNKSQDQLNYDEYEKFIQFIKDNSINSAAARVLRKFEPTFDKRNREIEVFLKSNSERLPIGNFGTGIMQILLILAIIHKAESKIVLIEELELNLSPKSQQELLKILIALIGTKKIDQIIFTSHSDILADNEDLSVYKVEMLEAGNSKITLVEEAEDDFYEAAPQTRGEIATSLRQYGVKGPEWE